MIDAALLKQIVKYGGHYHAIRGVAPTDDFSFLLERLEDGDPTGELNSVYGHHVDLLLLPAREPDQSWEQYLERNPTEGVV